MSVIFSRAPLRISLGGGGTDLPSYYREHGGFLVSGAIDKYVYMLTHTVFQRRYRMKYSETRGGRRDRARSAIRSCARALLRHWRGNPLEIASVADVPAGTGMGSSGAFTVCLLKGLAHARRTSITPGRAGRGRVRDRDRRARRAGRQAGSLRRRARRHLRLHVRARRQRRRRAARARARRRCAALRDQLLLFYTGEARSASAVLSDQDDALQGRRRGDDREPAPHQGDRASRAASCSWTAISRATRELMHEHWQNKRRRSPGMANERIDDLYTLARRSGVRRRQARRRRRRRLPARVRARPEDTRQAMAAAGAPELPFDFEFVGAYSQRVRVSAPSRLRVGDRRLRADRRQAGRGAATAGRVVGATTSTRRRARPTGSVSATAARACATRRAARRSSPTWSSSRPPTTSSRRSPSGRCAPARTCWSRSRPGWERRRSSG